MLRNLYFVIAIIAMSGCDALLSASISDICDEYPQMCQDLNSDAWCRAEKSNIIKNRYNNLQAPSDDTRYQLLLNFEDYKDCISKASQIEHIKLREKTSDRIAGLITAERELQRLARDTEESEDPRLLYYHWSRFASQPHLEKFLAYQEAGQLETPELQLALASYYLKIDSELTKRILFHALELVEEGAAVHPDILNGLTNIFVNDGQYEDAYIWGYVALEFDVKNLDLPELEAMLLRNGSSSKTLKKQAEYYYEAIKDGEFRSPI